MFKAVAAGGASLRVHGTSAHTQRLHTHTHAPRTHIAAHQLSAAAAHGSPHAAGSLLAAPLLCSPRAASTMGRKQNKGKRAAGSASSAGARAVPTTAPAAEASSSSTAIVRLHALPAAWLRALVEELRHDETAPVALLRTCKRLRDMVLETCALIVRTLVPFLDPRQPQMQFNPFMFDTSVQLSHPPAKESLQTAVQRLCVAHRASTNVRLLVEGVGDMRLSMMQAVMGGLSELYARPSVEEMDVAMRRLLETAQRKLELTSLPHVRSVGLKFVDVGTRAVPDWVATHLPNVEQAHCLDVRFGGAPSMFPAAPSSASSSSSSASRSPPQRPPPPPKLSYLLVNIPPHSELEPPTPRAIAALPALRAELATLPALTRLDLNTPAAQFLLQHGVTAATVAIIGPHVTQLSITSTRRGASMQGLPPHLATQFPRLQELQLCGGLDDAAAELVLTLPCLQSFTYGWGRLTRSFTEWQEGPPLEWGSQTLDVASYALLPLERLRTFSMLAPALGAAPLDLTPTSSDSAVRRVLWAMQRPGWQQGLQLATSVFVIGPANPAYSSARQQEQSPHCPVLPAALVASAPLLAALPCVERMELCGALHLDAATWEALWRAPAEGDGGDVQQQQQQQQPHACLREVELDDKCTLVPDAWAALLPALPPSVRKLTVKARVEPPGVSGPSSERVALARPPTAAQLEMAAGAPRPVVVHVPGALAKAPAREWQGLCARVQAASGGRVTLKR